MQHKLIHFGTTIWCHSYLIGMILIADWPEQTMISCGWNRALTISSSDLGINVPKISRYQQAKHGYWMAVLSKILSALNLRAIGYQEEDPVQIVLIWYQKGCHIIWKIGTIANILWFSVSNQNVAALPKATNRVVTKAKILKRQNIQKSEWKQAEPEVNRSNLWNSTSFAYAFGKN